MKLYLKDTIFHIRIWNKILSKNKVWCEFSLPNSLMEPLHDYYKIEWDNGYYYYKKYDFQGISLAINESINEYLLEPFNQYFRNKIQYDISNIIVTNIDSVFHEIDHIKMTAYIDISEEELLYLKLKYPEIFEG